MNGSILATIQDGKLKMFVFCDTYEEQKALELIASEIRCVVEESLESVGVRELLVSVE